MALSGVLLVRLRGLNKVFKCAHTGGTAVSSQSRDMRWYSTKAGSIAKTGAAHYQTNPDNINLELLKQFPQSKNLLHSTISQSLGIHDLSRHVQYSCTEDASGVQKATVKLIWPCEIEEVGYATKRTDAERLAAAAACLKLKDMGFIGPNNQLSKRVAGRRTGAPRSSFLDDEEEDIPWSEPPSLAVAVANDQKNHLPSECDSDVTQALMLFPKPKALLATVIQVANSPKSLKELMKFRTVGRKLKTSELTLHWPETMTFRATAGKRVMAEKSAAALACMKLKELELLNKNNEPLTHAEYHRDQVAEAGKRQRRPIPLEIPQYLENGIKKYLAEYPVVTEVQKLWEEEDKQKQQALIQGCEEEDEVLITDAITGRPYKALSDQEAQQLSTDLQAKWERANPGLSVELPVDGHRQRVVSAVQSSRVVVIAGETGCGKTTRIPRFLLEDWVRGGDGAECNILVTQPRRISAVSVAHRVAQEMGPALKSSVGYQVRLESQPPTHSGGALLFLTVGVLLRKLQSNPSLKGISHVVVDEVHERDINTDLLLALLRSSLQDNPDLRVVLMSATGDNQRLAQYFGGCPIVKVPGFMYPVRDRYLEDVLREMGRQPPPVEESEKTDEKRGRDVPDLNLVADVIEHIDKRGEPGAILCFLPGWQDIRTVQEKLEEKPHFSSGSHMILPLHSSLSVPDQQTVFQRPQNGVRKIVLSTNIAETSVTIDDIVHVVDAGTHKEHSFDPQTKVSCLDTVWISRSNVTQRKGRAGRCQPGQAYHLFSQKQLESMSPFPIPEILRTPLESLVVQVKVHSPNCKAKDFLSQVLDSPEPAAVTNAVKTLQDIGVLDSTETLTPLGERIACMSCDPRLGKVLVLGSVFRCTLPMLSIVASLTRDPFHNSLMNRGLVRKAKNALSGSSYSDYLVFSRAVMGWRSIQRHSRGVREEFLHEYTLSRTGLRFINGLISQFSDNLQKAKLVSDASQCQSHQSLYNEHSNEDELLKAVLLAGLYPNLIQVKKGVVRGGRFQPNEVVFRTHTGPVHLHRSSVNCGKANIQSRWLTFFYAVKSSETVFMRDSSEVHPLALLLLTDGDIQETVRGGRVEVSLRGHSLVRCELPVATWEVLWELRTSIQAMLHRKLRNPDNAFSHSAQDGQLISLLVELLNNTDSKTLV